MDFVLKQRLVGAVVLVALGVIFIPMLLEGPKRNLVPEMEALPEPEDQPLSQPLEHFPAPAEIQAVPESAFVQSDPVPEPAEPTGTGKPDKKTEQGKKLPLPVPDIKPRVEAASAPQTAKAAPVQDPPSTAKALGRWVLQVGSFSSEDNALRLRDKLREAEFVTQVEKVRVEGKTHFRVRVGPYLEREDAERDEKKLAKSFDLKGRVLSYP